MANSKRTGARRKPQSRKASNQRPGAWVLFLSGLIPGLFVALLVHLHHANDGGLTGVTPAGQAGEQPRETGDRGGRDDQPRFEFYELLSEMEVVVPEESEGGGGGTPEAAGAMPEATTAPEPTDAPAEAGTPGDDGARYMVQAGSFRTHEDADRLKARLALIGVQAEIQSVEVDGGETWHRVRVGPFADRERVDSVRDRLQDEDVDSILLRLRG
ncbi:SPOR domain-containing protein [Aquisalimonas lutea]|uniref:SPOR domain-containing protein n=1 Tax=Aquisalimonas lutea TaxID=1327750 RepID=UPI0025B4747F|nr:SPOR domain-containing protein [Aquisalimonas lutea]MDN3516756.1 SPOR domain-containing protein [Aquisalimonas lutea]